MDLTPACPIVECIELAPVNKVRNVLSLTDCWQFRDQQRAVVSQGLLGDDVNGSVIHAFFFCNVNS